MNKLCFYHLSLSSAKEFVYLIVEVVIRACIYIVHPSHLYGVSVDRRAGALLQRFYYEASQAARDGAQSYHLFILH